MLNRGGEYEKIAFIDQYRSPSRKEYPQVYDYDDSFSMSLL